MTEANPTADSISGPPGSRLLNESEVQTRRGKVRVWTFKPLNGRHSNYTYFVMIGRPEAVTVHVARALEGCTQCYEHMFHLNAMTILANGDWRAECTANAYAGD